MTAGEGVEAHDRHGAEVGRACRARPAGRPRPAAGRSCGSVTRRKACSGPRPSERATSSPRRVAAGAAPRDHGSRRTGSSRSVSTDERPRRTRRGPGRNGDPGEAGDVGRDGERQRGQRRPTRRRPGRSERTVSHASATPRTRQASVTDPASSQAAQQQRRAVRSRSSDVADAAEPASSGAAPRGRPAAAAPRPRHAGRHDAARGGGPAAGQARGPGARRSRAGRSARSPVSSPTSSSSSSACVERVELADRSTSGRLSSPSGGRSGRRPDAGDQRVLVGARRRSTSAPRCRAGSRRSLRRLGVCVAGFEDADAGDVDQRAGVAAGEEVVRPVTGSAAGLGGLLVQVVVVGQAERAARRRRRRRRSRRCSSKICGSLAFSPSSHCAGRVLARGDAHAR